MVAGRRPRQPGQELFSTEMFVANPIAPVKETARAAAAR
jgi:hypothetical protein